MFNLPRDKLSHFFYGQMIAIAGLILFSPAIAFSLVFLAAVGKEIKDLIFGGHVELLDSLATLAGGLIPILLILYVN